MNTSLYVTTVLAAGVSSFQSTILVIQDISASAYRLQVCSPSQPVLCGILHLTELKDGTFQAIGVFLMPTRLNYS